jgi:hypothetical protein
MLPEVKQLVSLDDDRDGGSIGVSFRDGAGELVGLVVRRRLDAFGRIVGYETPELQRHVPHAYTSKIDGEQLEYRTREDTPLSWEDAGQLLARLAPHLDDAPPRAAWVVPALMHAVASRGGVPADLPPAERPGSR